MQSIIPEAMFLVTLVVVKRTVYCVVACTECHGCGCENASKDSLATNINENDDSDTEDYDILYNTS